MNAHSPDASATNVAPDTVVLIHGLWLTALSWEKGLRNKEIARVIGRTEETIKAHLKHIMSKLGASDLTEAVTIALQRGIIHLYD